jgi:hypothetical protein
LLTDTQLLARAKDRLARVGKAAHKEETRKEETGDA